VVGGRRRPFLRQIFEGLSADRQAYYRLEILRFELACQRLGGRAGRVSPASLDLVAAKIKHLKQRAGLPCNRLLRLPWVLKETLKFNYFRYARNWQSIAMDLFLR
jgi:hypothetical protein